MKSPARMIRLHTPVGTLDVERERKGITRVSFFESDSPGSVEDPGLTEPRTWTESIRIWFRTYFSRGTVPFTPLLRPEGTDFQRIVWRQLRKIPFGETRTYGDVAKAVGRESAARAVGRACGANPVPILIPCHRVVSAGEGIGGYSGPGTVKKRLLEHELNTNADELEAGSGVSYSLIHANS